MTKMCYDVLLTSLSASYYKPGAKPTVERWVRRIWANTLSEAGDFAKSMHPNLGCTPTTVSMGWYIWPTPEPRKTDYYAGAK